MMLQAKTIVRSISSFVLKHERVALKYISTLIFFSLLSCFCPNELRLFLTSLLSLFLIYYSFSTFTENVQLSKFRRPNMFLTLLLTFRFSLFFVYLTSFSWSISVVPFLANNDFTRIAVEAFPNNVTLNFHINSSSLVYVEEALQEIDSNSSAYLEYELDLQFLDAFRLKLPKTPIFDGLRGGGGRRTISTFVEFFYRFISGNWIVPKSSQQQQMLWNHMEEQLPEITEISEYYVGERVFSGGDEIGMKRKAGTIMEVLPHFMLNKFQYLVHWDHENITMKEQAVTLVPKSSKIYFFYQSDNRIENIKSLPKDALAVFTRKEMAILQGFSFYFDQYWKLQPTQSSSSKEEVEEEDNDDDTYAKTWDSRQQCPAPTFPPIWNSIGLKIIEKWKPLYFLGVLLCEKSSPEHITCSREIGEKKRQQLIENKVYIQKISWWMAFFLEEYATIVATHLFIIVFIFFPLTFIVVNSLRNVDDVVTSFSLILHISARYFDCIALLFHIPNTFQYIIDSERFSNFVKLFFSKSYGLVIICWMINCGIIISLRGTSEKFYEEDRKKQLSTRKRKPILSGENICRICLSPDGELISPCICDGSMRFVHMDCLSQWRFSRMQNDSFYRCDLCRYRYKTRKTWQAIIFRSSLFISLLSLMVLFMSYLTLTIFFKLLDHFIIGKRLTEFALGPKISFYIQQNSWYPYTPPLNPMERKFVENTTHFLKKFDLELGHVVLAFILSGIYGFLSSNSYAIPWLWGTSEDTGSQEEGVFVYIGGRIGIVVIVGTYRLFSTVWDFLERKSTHIFAGRASVLVSVEPIPWKVPVGTLVGTPYGQGRVIEHRENDDVLVMELFERHNVLLYRDAKESASNDIFLH